MSADKTFVDANILIYAYTADEPAKQEKALKFLDDCRPVISIQVLREFANVLLKKRNVKHEDIKEILSEITEIADVVHEDLALIFASFDIHERYKYSFYDSLIIAAAVKSQCRVLLSEDMRDGQIINGTLKIINPLR
jgi:predicted nucleic acid-binding protein